MKRSILVILCAALFFCAMAETPRLSRAQLRQATVSKSRTVTPKSSFDGQGKPVTLQQVLKERNLTYDDNRLMAKGQHRLGFDEIEGNRIASMDVYDFEWDDVNGIATVIDSSCAIAGKYCEIERLSQDEMYVSGLFDEQTIGGIDCPYCIPLVYDAMSGVVKIKTGVVLDECVYEITSSNRTDSMELPRSVFTEVICTVYAMPLSWLMGDDEYDDIFGQICDDGTFVFYDDFAFLVAKRYCYDGVMSETTHWGLSSIYENLTLLMPNGTHEFAIASNVVSQSNWSGGGGLSPRPINPRPGNTKPVKPRSFSAAIDDGEPGRGGSVDVGNGPKSSADGYGRSASVNEGGNSKSDMFLNDVYVYMLDDTTLMVYNLYGRDYCWNYMYFYPDGTISLPNQPVLNGLLSDTGEILYNCSLDNATNHGYTIENHYVPGNHGSCGQSDSGFYVQWDDLYLCSENGQIQWHHYTDNKLYLNEPLSYPGAYAVFAEPVVTDSTVVFTAKSMTPGVEVIMVVYDESGSSFEVDIPWSAPRGEEPYWICLGALTYNEDTDVLGEWVYISYEVPALEHPFMLGDVNNDGAVNIRDVTALIQYLLDNDESAINVNQADVNRSDSLNITDVTVLINYLLTGQWPESNR